MWCWRSYRKSAMFWIIEESWRTWSSPLHLSETICRSCWTDVPTPGKLQAALGTLCKTRLISCALLSQSFLQRNTHVLRDRILRNHPRLIVKYVVLLRMAYGEPSRATKMVSILRRVKDGRHSLQVLDFVGAECDRKDRRVVHADGRWLRKNPTLPDKYQTVSDGLT